MADKTLVVICSATRAAGDQIKGMLETEQDLEIRIEDTSSGVIEMVDFGGAPGILILDLGQNWQKSLDTIPKRTGGRNVPVVVIAMESDPQAMRMAMRAGARDFHVHPVKREELLADINRLAVVAVQSVTEASAGTERTGQITAVINAKGGSGASIVACNLAHILQAHRGFKTGLIDMDMQFGALPLALDLKTRDTLFDALGNSDNLDPVALEGYMSTHESGLKVLGAMSNELPMPWQVSMDDVQKIMHVSSHAFDHVVVDLTRYIDPLTSTVLESADSILLVMEQSFAHLRDAVRMFGILNAHLGIPLDRVHLIVNRYNDKNPVTLEDISDALKQQHITLLPNDFYNVSESLNLGIPLYKRARNSALTKALCELTIQLRPDGGTQELQSGSGLRSRLSSVFGRGH